MTVVAKPAPDWVMRVMGEPYLRRAFPRTQRIGLMTTAVRDGLANPRALRRNHALPTTIWSTREPAITAQHMAPSLPG